MRTLGKPSPATAIGLVALFFALGGTAIAANHYLITSTNQIKPSVLSKLKAAGPDGAAGPAGATGPAGPAGPAGQTGPTGATGPTGPTNLSGLTVVLGPKNRVPAYNELGPSGFEGIEGSTATCPSGDRAVSGGFDEYAGLVSGSFSEASENRSSWVVGIANDSTFTEGFVRAVAYCAGSGQAVAASAPTQARARAAAQENVLLASLARELHAERTNGG